MQSLECSEERGNEEVQAEFPDQAQNECQVNTTIESTSVTQSKYPGDKEVESISDDKILFDESSSLLHSEETKLSALEDEGDVILNNRINECNLDEIDKVQDDKENQTQSVNEKSEEEQIFEETVETVPDDEPICDENTDLLHEHNFEEGAIESENVKEDFTGANG